MGADRDVSGHYSSGKLLERLNAARAVAEARIVPIEVLARKRA
jgi:hypothetical protein